MPRPAFVFVLLLVANGCISSLEQTAEVRAVALCTDYASGGDAPISQSLVFFTDGTVRLRSLGQAPQWATLADADRQAVETLLSSSTFRESVGRLPRTFACCDARELAISFEKSVGRLDAVKNPPTAALHNQDSLDPSIQSFLVLRDTIGRRYFGRKVLAGERHTQRWSGLRSASC